MGTFSYDIVSELNISELNNVFDQLSREIATRYDFKNTNSKIEWLNTKKEGLILESSDELHLDAMIDILRQKIAKRNLSQSLLDLSKEKIMSNLRIKFEIIFKAGINKEQAKEINRILKEHHPKLKSQTIAESIRVSAGSKDDLQKSIHTIKVEKLDYPIQFINFR